ncbi:myosin-10 [Selaginella moellendorffii]|uniref:myosin-10 n=1 Tax=Selaginella moellendorffii TaxID=88036 RepID=UPI000D1CCE49|nr:myosin-10 [Selaginella moellendorffii]|eukprot:XP_024523528.1 myosin-10 [Selaginella moellendorffii]
MGADSVLKMAKGVATWEFPALQRVMRLSAKSCRQTQPKHSPRTAPVTAPQVPKSSRKVAAELSVLMLKLETDFMAITGEEGREKWRCFMREGTLIEAWLDRMLQESEHKAAHGDTNSSLQEYGLSRVQLGILGLSESQIDRAYRMLYVYSVGCNEMIKELCLHSLEKAVFVELQAEIAELAEDKKNAIDELRMMRGCLNEALDGIALNRLLANEDWEVTDNIEATTLPGNGDIREAKEALERERSEAHHLRELCKKLEHDVEETERKTAEITWKFVQYDRDFPVLQKEHVEQECTILKHRVEHQDAALSLEAKVRMQQESLRALTVGIASLTPHRVLGIPKVSILSEVSIETEQSRAERRLSRRLSRKMSRRGTELAKRALEFLKIQQPGEGRIIKESELNEISESDLNSDEEWDDLCSELSQQREEMEKMEANLKEERDRRCWMERHVEASVKEAERLRSEVKQTNTRIVNLAIEKKNKEKNLQIAEEQIRKLDRQLESMELTLEKKNAEIAILNNIIIRNLERQAHCASTCKQLLTTGAKLLEDGMVQEMNVVGSKVSILMETVRLLRNKVTKAGMEIRSWKLKMKAADGQNAAMLAEMKTLKSELESSSADNISLDFKLQKEEQCRAKAEEELNRVLKASADLKLDQVVLEVHLESSLNKIMQLEMKNYKSEAKLEECDRNLNVLQNQKEKEDAIRGILQSEVDALRLEVEGLRRQLLVT